jgi:hypothetical protein
MSAPCVVEFAPFTLAEGVPEHVLLAASQRLEDDVLTKLPGYRGRAPVRKSERAWADLVFWQDRETADHAVKVAAGSEIAAAYFALMDPSGGITHFAVIRTYGGLRI